jgi:hypothetical protein
MWLPPMSGKICDPPRHKFLLMLYSVFLCTSLFAPSICSAEKIVLTEPATDTRVFSVKAKLFLKGHLKTPQGDNKFHELPLDVAAQLNYLEKRLTGTGRNAKALRSVRSYEHADVTITVQKQITASRLSDQHRLIVAQGEQDGILFYHLKSLLTYNELELLNIPGDSLALLSLLPPAAVEIGETWKPALWAVQMLTSTEAVEKSALTCKLESVSAETAHVSFQGTLEGASLGSRTNIGLTGSYGYDLKLRCIKNLELTQTEKRPTKGAITPGMDITATTTWERTPAPNPAPLTTQLAADIPLDPPKKLLRLSLQTLWSVRFDYDRNWHIFHQTDKAAVLRLLDNGSLIAQCNLTPFAPAAPGKHLSEERFQKYIQDSLGSRLKSIESAQPLKIDREQKHFIYRVVAAGKSEGQPMHWIYYLCADTTGRQTVFVFSVESSLIKQLNNRDSQIVRTLKFDSSNVKPISTSR